MKKRLLSGLLVLVLALTLVPTALAAPASEAEATQVLAALDIMVGDENGDLHLDRTVTRAEFTKMAVAASTSRNTVGNTVSVKPYPDVASTHWAAPYVKTAVDLGLVQGDLRGYFNPDRTITLAEGVTIVLRLLGYSDSSFTGVWPSGQMSLYRALDLDEGITIGDNSAMSRRDSMYLLYNLLATKNTSGQYHLNTLEPTLNLVSQSGEINQVAVVNSSIDGPVVAGGNWESLLNIDPAAATVYRAGVLSSYSAIRENDVVYWSKPMRTLWVYTNRAAGAINAITPSASPTSVTVAGKTYPIETSAAAYALSDLGSFRVGDTVTLLLGRSGGVAAVLGGSQTSVTTVLGLVTAAQTGSYSDGNGNAYLANTITLTATDGSSYSYRCDNTDIEAGDLVQVTVTNANITVKRLSTSTLSGKVSTDGTKLGSYTFADDVQILDTYKQSAVRVYPSRLAGMTLSSSHVRCYQLDSNGDISRLILSDATGDMHTYGVITDITEVDSQYILSTTGIYVYDAAGIPGVVQGSKIYSVDEGPMVIKWDGDAADRIANLTSVKLDAASGTSAQSGTRTYAVSDQVVVYELRDGDHYLSSLNLVNQGGYTLTGYYDKAETEGGCIRVIVAKGS